MKTSESTQMFESVSHDALFRKEEMRELHKSHFWVISQEDVVMDSPSSSKLAHFPKFQTTAKSFPVSTKSILFAASAPLQRTPPYF